MKSTEIAHDITVAKFKRGDTVAGDGGLAEGKAPYFRVGTWPLEIQKFKNSQGEGNHIS